LQLVTGLSSELSLLLKHVWITEEFTQLSGLVTHSLTAICSTFVERKVLQAPDLVQVVFDVLDDSWSTVLDKIVHGAEGFEDSTPFLRLALDLLPEMLHDNVIVLPVVGVVGEDL